MGQRPSKTIKAKHAVMQNPKVGIKNRYFRSIRLNFKSEYHVIMQLFEGISLLQNSIDRVVVVVVVVAAAAAAVVIAKKLICYAHAVVTCHPSVSFQEWPVRLQRRQGFAQSWRGVAPTPPWRSSAAPHAKCQVWHVWIRARLEQWTINLDAQQIRGLEKSNDLIQSFKLHRVSLNSWRDRKAQYMHTTGSIYHHCNESMSNIHLQSKVGL